MAKFHTIAFALLATSLTAQSTWTVDPSGNGDFLSLSAAQTGATIGDTLIVVGAVPGITLTKRLNIVAHGASITTALGIYATGGLSVSGGDFAGITVANATASLDDVTSARLRVTGNGTVSARDCTFYTTHAIAVFQPAVAISANGRAVFDGCTFQGADPWIYGVFYPVEGTAGLDCEGHAELRNCNVLSGQTAPHPILGAVAGGPSIELSGTGAHVDLKSCVLTAGGYPQLNGSGSARVENYAISAAAGVSVVNTNLPWMTGTSDYPGGTLAINVDSTPSTLATISASIGMQPPIATPIGRVWLSHTFLPVTAGFTDANGELATTIAVPTMVTRGLTVTFQGVVFPTTGGITATAPAILHVL